MYDAGSINIFGTTIHEIAHSTHAANAIFIFPVAEKRMRETYAETIEWYLTTKYYVQRNPNFIYQKNLQTKTPTEDPVYTSFMVDLIDDVNQRDNGPQFPIDNVEGYSMRQIENMVMNNATFTGFKYDLKRVYNNSTEGYLDQLRNNW